MTKLSFIRVGIYLGGIGIILLILTLSVTKQALYAPTSEELVARRQVSFSQRLYELSIWPPTPDHPLYPFRMAHDQIVLITTPPTSLAKLQLQYADDRFQSALVLIDRRRLSLALTTLTKSTKYVMAAARTTADQTPKTSNEKRHEIADAITTQKQLLLSVKPAFSDEQKAIIDRLLLELNALQEQFL